MQIFELAQKQQSTLLIESVCCNLTRDQRRIVEGIVSELRPLFETTLTAAQIEQIFGLAQKKQAAQGGVGRTTIGKAVDATKAVGSAVGSAAGAVNKAIDGLGGFLQDTRLVKYFDKKFETLKTNIAAKLGDDSNTMAAIDKLGQYARTNPGKTAFVIGTLTAIAALTTGPAGGAVAGQVLRAATELLKGEQLSTALGKGAKSAAIGGLVGAGAKELGGMLSSTMQAVADQLHPGVNRLMLDWKNVFGQTVANINVRGLPQDIEPIQAMWRKAVAQYSSGNYSKAVERLMQLDQMVDKISTPEYISKLSTEIQDRKNWQAGAKAFKKAIDTTVAAAQGVATATTANTAAPAPTAATAAPAAPAPTAPTAAPAAPAAGAATNQVRERYTRLTNKEIREIFAIAGGQITEGPVLDKLKSFGTKLTTKQVDTAALLNHWKFAKSPTDSGLIAKILRSNNVSDNVIKDIFDEMNIEIDTPASGGSKTAPAAAPAAAGTPVAAATTYNFAKAAADKLAKGQADQQAALQQVKANTAANTVKSAADGKIKADADAAKAKPGFQQTFADRSAIKTAAARGIRENKQILKIYETMTPEQRKQLIKNLEIIDDRDRPFTYPAESLKRQRKI